MQENISSRNSIFVSDGEVFLNKRLGSFCDFYTSQATTIVFHPYRSADLHSHNYYEIEFIISGSGVCHFNGIENKIERGSVMFLAPASVHDFHISDGKPLLLSMRLVSAYDVIIDELFPNTAGFCYTLSEETLSWIEAEIMQSFEIYPTLDSNLSETYMKNVIQRILIRIASIVTPWLKSDSPSRETKLVGVLTYIRRNFKDKLTLVDVATRFGYSANHMSRRIKEATGKSFVDYVTELRMSYAHAFVTQTDKSFKSICINCGYRSYPCFLKAFQHTFGKTPSEVRNEQIQNTHNFKASDSKGDS